MQNNTLTITIKANSTSAQAALERMSKAVDDVSDRANKSTKKASTGFEKLSAAAIVVGNVISNVVVGAFDLIGNSISSAVKRVDTMNNFPKVMSNLGIATEDSSAAIKRMADRLKGLPTALDNMAAGVQRVAATTGDVNSATDIMLAFNDAVLAGGMSAEVQSSAIEQFSQAFGKGKPDTIEWRSILNAMPAQMKQLATALKYPNVEALGEALRLGELSMQDFSAAIVKLDKQGGDGIVSFHKQAIDATGGIQTGWTNAQTAITRGVSNIISSIGSSKISEIVSGIGTAFETVLTNIGGLFAFMIENGEVFGTFAAAIAGASAAIILFNTYTKVTAAVTAAYTTVSGIATVATNLMSQGMGAAKAAMLAFNVVTAANPIGFLIVAIGALVAAFVFLWNNVEGFRNFFIGAFTQIGAFVQTVVGNIIAFFQSIPSAIGAVVEKVVGFFSGIGKKIGEFIGGAIKGVINGALGLIEGFLNTPINIINGALGLINLLPGVDIPMIPKIQLPRMEEGGVLGGSSYVGDRQMFMGNTGEMVINRRDQAALFDAIKSGEFGGGGIVIEEGAVQVEYRATGEGSEIDAKNIGKEILRQLISQGLKPDLSNVATLR